MSANSRADFNHGQVYCQNLQSESITKVLGGTGTDTVAVTFKKSFRNVPKICVQRTSSASTTNYVSDKTTNGFTLNISSSSLTDTVTYDYIAFDDHISYTR
jgi:hypothetical protein